jgi:hypothetical protein
MSSPSRRHHRTTSPSSMHHSATSPSPTVRGAPITTNMVREVSAGVQLPTAILSRQVATGVPSTRVSDLGVESIILPRTRPNNAPSRDPYARNNDFLVRIASAERIESELARLQRPTPPPAIGHGRPIYGSSEFVAAPRDRSRPRPVPRWQRDQENSEEAAMSVLQADMRSMYLLHELERDAEHDRGIMDNTPPKETRMDRYLRE